MNNPDWTLFREQFDIKLSNGRNFVGRVYGTQRRTGRRITVTDSTGKIVFDTDDCFYLGNATASLNEWVDKQEKQPSIVDRPAVSPLFS